MENPDLTKMMIEISKDVQDIKTSLKFITKKCEREEINLKQIDDRLEAVETKFEQMEGAWKLIVGAVSLGLVGFLVTLYNYIKSLFGG